jgi:hypothetical protein
MAVSIRSSATVELATSVIRSTWGKLQNPGVLNVGRESSEVWFHHSSICLSASVRISTKDSSVKVTPCDESQKRTGMWDSMFKVISKMLGNSD